jgi:hypothetical protein
MLDEKINKNTLKYERKAAKDYKSRIVHDNGCSSSTNSQASDSIRPS